MRKIILLFLLFSIVFASCSSTKKSQSISGTHATYPQSVPKSTDDGLSYQTAIVITEKTETKGIDAEYKWIKDHYSDCTIEGQALVNHDKKPYDVITITFSDGKELPLYFDIFQFLREVLIPGTLISIFVFLY